MGNLALNQTYLQAPKAAKGQAVKQASIGDISKGLSQNQEKFSPYLPKPQGKSVDLSRLGGLQNSLKAYSPSAPMSSAPRTSGGGKSTSNLGTVTVEYGGGTKFEGGHPAIDIANRKGTPIPAFTGGKVVEVRGGMGNTPGQGSFGNYVIIEDRMGNKHRYSHLDQSYVQLGQTVQRGAPIATMGNSGGAYSQHGGDGTHLDYRIQDAYGKYMNPSRYLL